MKFKKVYIELTNICGLNCTFCPPTSRKNHIMDLEIFENINKQLTNITKEVAYHIVGDPLILFNLLDYLDISHKYKLKVNITTSGFYIDKSKFTTLCHPCIRQVNFSLDSFNANQPKMDFEKYIGNILDFCQFKLENGFDFFINLRLWNLNDKQTAYNYNKKIFNYLENYFKIAINIDEIYKIKPKNIRLNNKILLVFDEYFEWPSLDLEYENENGFCYGLSSHFGIHSNGVVVPCCLDKNGIIKLGNINDTLLDDILKSTLSKQIIEGFKQKFAVCELCKKCNYKEKFSLK